VHVLLLSGRDIRASLTLSPRTGWGIVLRTIMPATGPAEERAWDRDEQDRLCEEQSDLLGDQIVDVYLNSRAYWSGVPAAAWDYEFDGFQVLRWLLSYRDKGVLGRDLGCPRWS